MNDLGLHVVLFVAISLGIVTLGVFYGDQEDGRALRALPKRLVYFMGGCVLLVLVVLLLEHTVARIH